MTINDDKELDKYLWPYAKPLPNSVVLSRGVDEQVFQMPYNTLKQAIKAWAAKQAVEASKEQIMQDFLSINMYEWVDESELIQWRENQLRALQQGEKDKV